MATPADAPTVTRSEGSGLPRAALFALALGSFAIGCTEFVAVGLLPQIAQDFGVAEGAVGQLVTLNALAVAIGAPALGALTARMACRPVLIWTLVAFALAHLVAAVAPSFPVLLLSRLVTGAAFGLFLAVGFAAAARLADESRRAGALAIVQGGITTATALGVPLGMLLAGTAGSAGWRLPFVAIALLALAAAGAISALVPRLAPEGLVSTSARLGVLLRWRVALGITMIATFWAGSFAAFTYVVPLLVERGGLGQLAVIGVLLLAGLLSVGGNVLGGRGADRALSATLVVTAAVTLVGLLGVFVLGSAALPIVVFIALWQLAAWSFVPAAQAKIYALGEEEGEAAVSFSVAAFNVGIVVGAGLGGLALESAGLGGVGVLASVLAAVALAVTVVVVRLRTRADP